MCVLARPKTTGTGSVSAHSASSQTAEKRRTVRDDLRRPGHFDSDAAPCAENENNLLEVHKGMLFQAALPSD
ncbi:hypothetical protein AAE478_007413 [Parahypoxylon ruwenzoriense]